jgi:hypothetical protein
LLLNDFNLDFYSIKFNIEHFRLRILIALLIIESAFIGSINMKKLLTAVVTFITATSAYAGTSTGIVQNFHVMSAGKLFFYNGVIDGRPSCNNGAWAVDLIGPNAAAGKAIYATILMAYSTGKTVFVQGKGTCDVWGDRETVEYVYVY